MSDKLKFGDLELGDKFIGFPFPGDDAGHGGYKGGHVLYQKIQSEKYPFDDPTYEGTDPIITMEGMRVSDGVCSVFPDFMHVVKII